MRRRRRRNSGLGTKERRFHDTTEAWTLLRMCSRARSERLQGSFRAEQHRKKSMGIGVGEFRSIRGTSLSGIACLGKSFNMAHSSVLTIPSRLLHQQRSKQEALRLRIYKQRCSFIS